MWIMHRFDRDGQTVDIFNTLVDVEEFLASAYSTEFGWTTTKIENSFMKMYLFHHKDSDTVASASVLLAMPYETLRASPAPHGI